MNRIRQLRDEKNITQEELAKKLNLSSKGIVSMYEKDDRKPSLEVLIKLSDIFDCSIDYILCKSDIRNPQNIEQDILNEALIGMSRQEYEKLTEEQKESIRKFIRFTIEEDKKGH